MLAFFEKGYFFMNKCHFFAYVKSFYYFIGFLIFSNEYILRNIKNENLNETLCGSAYKIWLNFFKK